MPMAQLLIMGSPAESRAIDQIVGWIEMVRHRLEREFSLEWLGNALLKGLREHRQPLTDHAIDAARAGDEICNKYLRVVFREIVGSMFSQERRGPGYLQILAYGERAVEHAPPKRPRGHRWHDDWIRNIQFCTLIVEACREFGVNPTRDPDCTSYASGCSLVVAAFNRAGLKCPREESMQRHIWLGLPGEIVRSIIPPMPTLISERIFEQNLERASKTVDRKAITAQSRAQESEQINSAQPQALPPLRRQLLSGVSHIALARGLGWKL
jgi:hypothetical protein